jgi:GDP-L-fucose synthase
MKQTIIKGKKVLVTGGAGFLGKHVIEQLKKEKPSEIFIPRSKDYDLRDRSIVAKLVKNYGIIIHLAANVGGIGYNQEHPAELYYDNMVMGVHIIHEAYKAGVEKVVALGTICAYPKFTPIPFKEEDIWKGYPEETNAPYGLAKKMMLVQAQSYRDQYDFNSIFLLPTNLYGPHDNFDPKSSHVIPALIRKYIEAKEANTEEVIIWGTGSPTREFLYVEDAAKAIVMATKNYNGGDPVNLGSSFEISIAELAHTIGDIVKYKGKLTFDTTKPDGQPRRKIDTTKAQEEFGFKSSTTFKDGLKKTIEWYKKNR